MLAPGATSLPPPLQGRLTFGDAGSTRDVGFAYGLAAGLGLLTFVQGLLHHRLFYLTMRGGKQADIPELHDVVPMSRMAVSVRP